MNCLECQEVMVRFIDGSVDGKTRKEVGLHLADCPECMRLIEGGKFWDDAVLKLLDHEAPADLRSEILGDLGEGGLDDLGWKKNLKIMRWASTRNNSPWLWLQAVAWAAGIFLLVEFVPQLWSDFRQPPRNSPESEQILESQTLYEKILPNGDVELHTSRDVANSGTQMMRSVDWEVAQGELEEVRAMEVRDPFGNLLPVQVSRRENGSYLVEINLEVPIAPSEKLSLSVKRLRRQAAQESPSGVWTYTFRVDFSEDRFMERKIEFPRGAKVEIPDGWQLQDLNGRVFLYSSAFNPARTVSPQVIEYRYH